MMVSKTLRPRFYDCCSIFSRAFFRSTPHRYPPMLPSSLTTRWHGIATATGLVAHARATARQARGWPIPFATWLYDFVAPNGIDCRYVHTRRWNAVARMSSGNEEFSFLPRMEFSSAVTHDFNA